MAMSDIDALLKELYIGLLPEVFTKGDALCNELMKADHKQANTRAVVFDLEVAPGGDFKGMDFDGGAYPLGNSMVVKKPTVSSVGVTQGWNVTSLMDWATKNDALAVKPVLSKTINDAMDNFKIWLDSLLNASTNNGVLDIITDVVSAPTYEFDTAASPYGGYLLMPGGRYEIWSPTAFPTTKRANGPYRIDPDGGLDLTAGPPPTVTFTASITGAADGDYVVVQDMAGACINPLWYHLSGSSSGTWQALSRSKIYTRAQRVDGASGPFTGPLARTLLNLILKFKGDKNATAGLRPYMGYEQMQNYENSGLDIAQIILGGVGPNAVNKKYDMLLGEGTVEGRPILAGNHCDPTKVGFLNVDSFVWIETRKITMEPNDAGGYLHRIYDTTLGTPKASHSIYINWMGQLGCKDATGMGVIDTLSLP